MPWVVLFGVLVHASVLRVVAPRRYPTGDTTGVTTFAFDDARLLDRRHRHAGAVWVTPHARPGEALPLYIYLHGLNRHRILRRWMHGSHWDMRAIVGPLAMEGRVGPLAVAVPATTGDSAQAMHTIYPRFDVAGFVEAADRALRERGFRVDRRRVIFSAHSASGCVAGNGLFAGVGSPAVETILDLDCCMSAELGQALATAPPWQRVVVVYQDFMWNNGRRYRGFVESFLRWSERGENPMNRVLERYELRGVDVHNDIVPIALRRWLPELVPPVGVTED